MKTIILSILPGLVTGALVDNLIPSLSARGFVYATVGGMIIFILLAMILSSLVKRDNFHNFPSKDRAVFPY